MPSTEQPICFIVDHSVSDILVNDLASRQTQLSSPDLCHPQLCVLLDPFSRLVVAAMVTFDSDTVHPSFSPNDLQQEGL